MPVFISRLLCKLFGHKGPKGTTYSVKPVTSQFASMKWACPRCGERMQGVMLGSDTHGTILNMATENPARAEGSPELVLGTRMDLRYRQPILEQIAARKGAVLVGGPDDVELLRKLNESTGRNR